MFDETLFKNSSDLDLVNYNLVRCNLEAFGKKVASRPGVLRTLVSFGLFSLEPFTRKLSFDVECKKRNLS
jgi:hypothetical protein